MTDTAHPDTGAVADTHVSDDPISRLSAILDEGNEQPTDEPAEGEAPDGDETASDEPAEGEADEDTPEDEPETPAIEPPVSWKADAKEKFAELPPELQQFVVERESQREKFVQAKATEAAEARRVVEVTQAQAAQLSQNYLATLQALLPEIPAEPDPAWLNTTVYGDEGPQTFYAHQQARNAAIAQHQQVQQLMSRVGQEQAQQDAQARAAFDAEQHRILSESIPGWSDPETRAALAKDITALAEALGYTPDRLADVDATDVQALYAVSQMKAKADKWDELQKAKMATVRAAKDLPKVAKPNAPQPPGSAKSRAFQQSRDRLRQSGSIHDAAAAIASRLG